MKPALLLVLLAPAPAAQDYLVHDLDGNGLTSGGVAVAVARTGDLAAGTATPAGGGWGRAVRWSGTFTQFLPLLAGDEAGAAYGVSDAGRVVGESIDIQQQGQLTFFFSRAVLWEHGQVVELASLVTSGDTDIEPYAGLAINNHGTILGWGKRPGITGLRGFVLRDGELTDLGALPGALIPGTEPFDLNEQGVVVGAAEAGGGFDHAITWTDGVLLDLHAASGVPGRNSRGMAIDEAGLVVGSADPVADFLDYEHAAAWQDGVLTFLPELGDGAQVMESFARDVNDHGTIVGTSVTPSFEVHAVIWRDGELTDLNALIPPGSGWLLANAHAISNDGRIVGEGFTPQGVRAYVLEPDASGGFDVYAAGCAGSGGFVPGLWGEGWPQSGGALSLALTNGAGGAAGVLLVGLGMGQAPFKGCTLANLPLSPLAVPLLLSPGGAGGGQWTLPVALPPAVPAGSLFLQAALADAGGPAGVTVSNALRLDLAP
jgi:probable HAF family extracellular repeat protein